MTHVTCRLTAKNRDQLRNPTLGNRVWATFLMCGVNGRRRLHVSIRGFLSALEVFLNDMRYINPRFTYLLTYLLTIPQPMASTSSSQLAKSLCASMTSSTKLKIINVLLRRQRRTEPRPWVTYTENLVKIGRVVVENDRGQTNKHRRKQTRLSQYSNGTPATQCCFC